MSSFEEIIAAGVMGGEAAQSLAIGRATVKMAIMHHRTFFCPCGNGLDQKSAAVYETTQDGTRPGTTVGNGKRTFLGVICGTCHGSVDLEDLKAYAKARGQYITVNTWKDGEVKHATT